MNNGLIVCVDLDGVLNLFDEWKGAGHFHAPRPGAHEFLKALHDRNYQVVIFTVRWAAHVWDWLRQHGLDAYVDTVTDKKPPAHVYIDDRAICFKGDFAETLTHIEVFKPHWQQ